GGDAYYPEEPSPSQSQTHPFFNEGGVEKPERSDEIESLVKPVFSEIADDSITMPRPVLVQFEVENYDDEITSNNAQTSFDVRVDGQRTHFYLWDFKEENDGAIVTLRLKWPLEDDAKISIKPNLPKDVSAEDIKSLIERFESEENFSDDKSARALKSHMTAIAHYEKQNNAEKVLKHMDGFYTLLDHQNENEVISTK